MGARIAIAIAALFAVAACGGTPRTREAVSRDELSAADRARHQRLVEEAEALWRQRAAPEALETAIAKWQQAIALDGADWRSHARVARALQLFARLSGMDRTARVETFERGYRAAERGLRAFSPRLERLLETRVPLEDAIEVVGTEGVELLYWYAVNLAGYARAAGRRAALQNHELFLALTRRVYELDPNFYHRGADRLLGAFYGAAPPFLGGDLKRSRRHFETAIREAPNFLGSYVLMARYYATRAGNADLFDRLLKSVVEARSCSEAASSPCIHEGLAPEASVHVREARRLQRRRPVLFE